MSDKFDSFDLSNARKALDLGQIVIVDGRAYISKEFLVTYAALIVATNSGTLASFALSVDNVLAAALSLESVAAEA
jgi:hypothetical protein